MRRVYVASSWRNERQPRIVDLIRSAGFDVYDFRAPTPGSHGFHWSEVDPQWERADCAAYLRMLSHPLAEEGFKLDMDALEAADAVVLVLPCGRSAHLELGYAVGAGKRTAILLDVVEPELMNKMVDWIGEDPGELVLWLGGDGD